MMAMNKKDRRNAMLVAAQIASGWSDEYLLKKKPEDLMIAYGCSKENAEYVLKNELTKRKIVK